ncbi:hypothetical protein [Qipengyuania soli]|uniref:Uncharacterized protein n=1 Tax=Qipengyuania soli TaxID=2782568 RepID=A0A7S8F3I1_9SPHN|nr:hypothetical protein [Qipengyuania soli]QPC98451.1 hypothetical protein IRL76_11440 [Qipengyuania soli]
MRLAKLCVLSLALLGTSASGEDTGDEVTPLFGSDAVLDATIDGPVREVARRAESSDEVRPATLTAAGESHAIEISARGISRRRKDKCSFPPLRIGFPDKPDAASLFRKQKRIKLVTHCNDNARFEQIVLREYAAYRLYNILTPESFKVRLARVTYRDGGKDVTTRIGFFIEDGDDAAKRVGLKEVDTGNVRVAVLNREDGARYSLFQYMIGNTDWAMDAGPDPADCCHNSRLFGEAKDAAANLTPVPYDFDNAGLVDAPYAVPSEKLRIPNVRYRIYRGYCAFNEALPAQLENYRNARGEIEAELGRIPGLETRSIQSMRQYLAGFFEDIGDSDRIAKKLTGACL